MTTINFLCSGCILLGTFPNDCVQCNNIYSPSKNIPFTNDYYIIMGNNQNEQTVFGKIYKKSIDEFVKEIKID